MDDSREYDIINNIFTSWLKCKNNNVYIENKSDFDVSYPLNDNSTQKTLYVDTCKNMNIYLTNKINHITIINSLQISIYVYQGLISGLDIFNSKNINLYVINNKIDFTEISNSDNCNYHYHSDNLNDYVNVNTNNCYNIGFIINNFNIMTNKSLFSNTKYFILNNNTIRCFNDKWIEETI